MSRETNPPSPAAPAESCPVDHATREAWLKNNGPKPTPFTNVAVPESKNKPSPPSCSSAEIDQPPPSSASKSNGGGIFSWLRSPFSSSSSSTPTPAGSQHKPPPAQTLATSREVSTIPRASATVPEGHGSAVLAAPANSEIESGAHSTGNWVYPSEKMFFEAMKRKGYSSDAKEMRTVVPIHNAVNERAWKEIKEWERPWGAEEKCGGPKLHSFLGLSTSLSPKARFNSLLGYTTPFDRHDWVVDRCGTKIEYIIDFYAGKADAKGNGKLSFYLDVRPKLNTWEGWKMRGFKALGLV